MSPMPAPSPRHGMELRWVIRREQVREPRFGETRLDIVAWCVRDQLVSHRPGRRPLRLREGTPTYFPSLQAAHAYARRQAAAYYGKRHRR